MKVGKNMCNGVNWISILKKKKKEKKSCTNGLSEFRSY